MQHRSGFAVPLGALRTEESPVIGEYTSIVQAGEFAKKCGLSVIQLLPILDSGTQSSPYSSVSAFALHPIYINLSRVLGFDSCIADDKSFKQMYDALMRRRNDERFDYAAILGAKERLLKKMWSMIIHSGACCGGRAAVLKQDFDGFIGRTPWLKSYCVFKALKEKYAQASSLSWKKEDRNLTKDDIERSWNDKRLQTRHLFYAFEQFVAYRQLTEASGTVRGLGIILKGDLPILLNEDSCDAWESPGLFNRKLRAGSPPDGDNPTGQNWGFPVYDWAAQRKDGFSWWKLRLSECAKFFGAYRLDHIPGFFRIWAMPAGEKTAELGRAEPHAAITRIALLNAGFSKERIRWLSEPHIPTTDILRITGNLEMSHEILGLLCTRIGFEELWNFRREVRSSADIEAIDLSRFALDGEIQREVTALMLGWWKDRTLIETEKGKFVPRHNYGETRAWNSLNGDEKAALQTLFAATEKKQAKAWKAQAEEIFRALVPGTDMVPCGENLGAGVEFMPETMEKFGILGLKVVRWCRDWSAEGQPFEDVAAYPPLSLVTTSVHDSPTLRQWWNGERDAAQAFERAFFPHDAAVSAGGHSAKTPSREDFSPSVAEKALSVCARTRGAWFVPPIQDWLHLDDARNSKCWSAREEDERVNVPGTVSDFNWTYRVPLPFERLMEKGRLIEKIRRIAALHDGAQPAVDC